MAKPSIFSSDYEKRMRKRKFIFKLVIAIVVFLIAGAIIYYQGFFQKHIKSPIPTKIVENTKNSESPKQKVQTSKEEGFEFKLSDQKILKAVYEINGSEKKFKYISPKESNIPYDISPSGKNIVVFDSAQQTMMLMDIDGNVQDISNLVYITSSGAKISKDSVLQTNNNYIWCQSPKFIDDTNVAYVSQLPWLKKTTKYIWEVNISTKVHSYIRGIEAQDIKIDVLESKGLKIIEDGKIVYLTPDGSIIN